MRAAATLFLLALLAAATLGQGTVTRFTIGAPGAAATAPRTGGGAHRGPPFLVPTTAGAAATLMRTRTSMRGSECCVWREHGGRRVPAGRQNAAGANDTRGRRLTNTPGRPLPPAARLLRQADAGLAAASAAGNTATGSYYLLASTPLAPMGGSAVPGAAGGGLPG